jgi:hypothetical protein
MKRHGVVFALCVLSLLGGRGAHALSIRYDLEGIIETVTQTPSDPLGGPRVGDVAKGYLQIFLDDAIIGSVTPSGTVYDGPVESMSFSFGKTEWNYSEKKEITVGNNRGGKDYFWDLIPRNRAISYSGPTQSGLGDLVLKFEGPEDTIQDESLATAGFLEKFSRMTFSADNLAFSSCELDDVCFAFAGTFTKIEKHEIPVPEPGTATLLGLGLAAAAGWFGGGARRISS